MSRHWRLAGILPAIAFVFAGWLIWHEPGHAAGLLACAVLTGASGPVAVLMAPAWPAILVSRRQRAAWRQRHPRAGPVVPGWLRLAVLAADRNRCVYCGSAIRLQVDHITPWAAGGLSVMWNLACLCRSHNVVKSNFSVDPDGYVHYRPFAGCGDPVMAAAILAAERRLRANPGRWLRAAWSLR